MSDELKDFQKKLTLNRVIEIVFSELPEFEKYKPLALDLLKPLNADRIDKILRIIYKLLKEIYE